MRLTNTRFCEKKEKKKKIELECLLVKFIYSNSKFKVTCKKGDFECRYIRTHTKEKPSKISNITFANLPLYQKKTLKLNGHSWVGYFGTYYFWWNHEMLFKMVHFNIKNAKSRVCEFQVCNLCTTYSSGIISQKSNIILNIQLISLSYCFLQMTHVAINNLNINT